LFDVSKNCGNGAPPYLLRDKSYPLVITWIMTPFKEEGTHTMLELFYSRKHKQGWSIVENAFGILNKKFRALLQKSNLQVSSIPNVFSYCCMFHNLLRDENEASIE
jgi:hypothetical protein